MVSKRRYLQFRNHRTGEAETPIDVSDRSEREIEKIERGMLRNCDVENGWYVDDTDTPAEPDAQQEE